MINTDDFILSAQHSLTLDDEVTLQRTVTALEYDAHKLKANPDLLTGTQRTTILSLVRDAGVAKAECHTRAREALLGDDIDGALKLTSICAQYEDLETLLKLV